jgi:KaiC/GvpD/RAD55 family RecA-like ATPase
MDTAVGRVDRKNRRTTGLVGLDLALDGGFPRGTTIIASGTATTGLDLFAGQFWRGESEAPEEGSYLMLDAEPAEGMTDLRGVGPEEFPQRMHGQKVVIDSLSTVILKYGIEEALELMRKASAFAAENGANVLLLIYSGIHAPEEEIRLFRTADGILELKQTIEGSEVERKMGIFKMKGLDLPRQLVPYNITAEGLELSTTKRVV